jgi:outer membrane protein TolC
MNGLAYRLTASALAVLISASTAFAYSDEAVEEAEKLVGLARQRLNSGYGSRTDLAVAEYYLLEMKYRAGHISRATYCKSGVQALKVQRDLFQNQFQAGTGDLVSLLKSRREFYKLTASCEERKRSK